MRTRKMLISVLISGLIALAVESVATADVAMIPNTRASGMFGSDSDAPLQEWFACKPPVPHQVRENPAQNIQDNRAFLDSVRPDPGLNSPSEELKMPNMFVLVRIPLDRTLMHPLTPNLDSPAQNEEASPDLNLIGDPLPLRLTYPLSHRLC